MSWFKKRDLDLSEPKHRKVDLNPSRKVLEWIEAVDLWEIDYFQLHKKHGWKVVEGYDRNSNSRFEPVIWQVGDVRVKATFDSRTGIVTEIVL